MNKTLKAIIFTVSPWENEVIKSYYNKSENRSCKTEDLNLCRQNNSNKGKDIDYKVITDEKKNRWR